MLLAAQSESPTVNVKAIPVPSAHVSDKDIIVRIKAGDIDAYGSIMRRYNQRVYRIARSIVTDDAAAMDIVQEAHIKAYTKLNDFKGKSSFITWLASIVRNEALMYLRKHKREVTLSIGAPEDESQFSKIADLMNAENNHESLPDAMLENKQLQKLIDQNIDKLREDFRTVFVLRAIERFNVRETAEILGIKEETVKTRFFRAKRLLRGQIQTYLDSAGMKIYEFGGYHCDIIVGNVLGQLHKLSSMVWTLPLTQ